MNKLIDRMMTASCWVAFFAGALSIAGVQYMLILCIVASIACGILAKISAVLERRRQEAEDKEERMRQLFEYEDDPVTMNIEAIRPGMTIEGRNRTFKAIYGGK